MTSLPYMSIIPPSLPVSAAGPLVLSPSQVKSDGGYPWRAETVVEWAEQVTGVPGGSVHRAALVPSRFVPLLSLGALGAAAALGWRLYHLPLLRRRELYAVGSLVVFWFSMSGGMYIIIRRMPLMSVDRSTHAAQLFLQGTGQLGAEGYIMGSLYLVVALSAITVTHALPRVRDATTRRNAAYACVVVAGLALRTIMNTHVWKTGTRPTWYLSL